VQIGGGAGKMIGAMVRLEEGGALRTLQRRLQK